MANQALEKLLDDVIIPTIGQERISQSIDAYLSGTLALYSSGKPLDPPIKPSYNAVVIPHPKLADLPGFHDTYKLDRYGNLFKGHSTINLPKDDKIRLNVQDDVE